MLQLPNGCSCSEPTIYPANWRTGGISLLKSNWYIQYRFRDPSQPEEWQKRFPYGKLVIVKCKRGSSTLQELRDAARQLLESERTMLIAEGYNPISRMNVAPPTAAITGEIEPGTPILVALDLAKAKLKVKKNTGIDIKCALGFIEKSVINLNLQVLKIQDVKRKHIRMVLDNCSRVKKYWSSHLYNHYRTYLMMLFKQLVELEAIDTNPVREISKQITVERLRDMLTDQERLAVDQHFQKTDPYYHRFMHIFFHSGARPIELLELKDCDVSLSRQCYKVTVNKGGKIREEERPIKDIAMPYWTELMGEISPKMFLFGKLLRPSEVKCTRDYITKRWQREIKNAKTGLGINKDLYSLKHLNLDETAEALSIHDAQKMAGHSSPVITMKHYATGEKGRQNERLRAVDNKFAG